MQANPMEISKEIPPKSPTQAKFYKVLKEFDRIDNHICARKTYDLIIEQKYLLKKMHNKLKFPQLQTIANYALYNAELSKIIAHSISSLYRENITKPIYNNHILYGDLESAKEALLQLTATLTYFSEIECYALHELSIGVHLLLMLIPREHYFYCSGTIIKELTYYLYNCSMIYTIIREQKKINPIRHKVNEIVYEETI